MPRAKNGSSTKIGVVWQKSDFLAKNRNFGPKKKEPLLYSNHVLATTGKSCSMQFGTPEQKVRKLFPRWGLNGLSEGYKRAVDQNWDRMAKIGFFGKKTRFWAQKKTSLLYPNHVLATTGKSCSKKKVAFSQIIKGENVILGDLLG